MAKRENFYRRDPGKALAGMTGMTLEERGVYNTIIDLLYLTWRPLEDSRSYIAAHCGCAVQKLNPLIDRLIAKGKLIRFEEAGQHYISNQHFEDERASVKGVATRSGRGNVEEKSPGVGEKSASVEENPPTCRDEHEEKQPVAALEKSRQEKTTLSNERGADAPEEPLGIGDVPADIAELEPEKRGWRLALWAVMERGGANERAARSFIGKLTKDHKLTAGELWEIALEVWRLGTDKPQAYLRKAAAGVAQRRRAPTLPLEPVAPKPEAETWRWRVERFKRLGLWEDLNWDSPSPRRAGCRAPAEILREFGYQPMDASGNVLPFPLPADRSAA